MVPARNGRFAPKKDRKALYIGTLLRLSRDAKHMELLLAQCALQMPLRQCGYCARSAMRAGIPSRTGYARPHCAQTKCSSCMRSALRQTGQANKRSIAASSRSGFFCPSGTILSAGQRPDFYCTIASAPVRGSLPCRGRPANSCSMRWLVPAFANSCATRMPL